MKNIRDMKEAYKESEPMMDIDYSERWIAFTTDNDTYFFKDDVFDYIIEQYIENESFGEVTLEEYINFMIENC